MSWFKPFKMQFAPFNPFEKEFDSAQIEQILTALYLPGTTTSIASLVTQSQQQNDVLGLTLKLPAGYKGNFEQLHQEMAQALEKLGVKELNLNLIEQKVSSNPQAAVQSSQSQPNNSLPPVTDASTPVPSEAVQR